MDANTWCTSVLKQHGYQLKSDLKPVRLMPWSEVYRVDTNKGAFFLKVVAKPFSIEAKLIQYLSLVHPKEVPNILAAHEALQCFIMEDGGTPLREKLKRSYDVSLAKKALHHYAKIQLESIEHLDDFIKLGVLDWRLNKLPSIFEALLKQNVLIEDGLTQEEICALQALVPTFAKCCQTLSQFSIPATIEHCDFHDNNILIKDDHLIFNDWGDTVVSHPFFSIISFLYSAGRAHGLTQSSSEYQALKSCYLENWLNFESQENLLKAYDVAMMLNYVKFVASFMRVRLCSDDQSMGEYQGVMAHALRELIPLLENEER